jgi:hypothetical protein
LEKSGDSLQNSKNRKLFVFLLLFLATLPFVLQFTVAGQTSTGQFGVTSTPIAIVLPSLPKPLTWQNFIAFFQFHWLNQLIPKDSSLTRWASETAITGKHFTPPISRASPQRLISSLVYPQVGFQPSNHPLPLLDPGDPTFGITGSGSQSYPTSIQQSATDNGNTNYNTGTIIWGGFTAAASGTISKIGIKIYSNADSVRVGLYSDSGSPNYHPYQLLGQSADTYLAAIGWSDISLTGSVYVVGGTAYWLALQEIDVNTRFFSLAANQYIYTESWSYGAFPSTATVTGNYGYYNVFIGRTTYVQIEGYAQCTQATGAAGTGTTVSFYAYTSGNYRLAVMQNNAGAPNTVVWELGSTAVSGPPGWQTVNISSGSPSSYTFTAITYWLCWQVDTVNSLPGYVSGGSANTGAYKQQAYGAFPGSGFTVATMGGAWMNWSMYVSVSTTATITFAQSGLGSDVAGGTNVFTIIGTSYTKSQLPYGFTWTTGDTHSVTAITPITGSTYTYDWSSWTNGDGLSTNSGTYTVPGSNTTVTATYVVRPLITFAQSGLGSDVTGGTTVLTIDSAGYTKTQLASQVFSWVVGSTHSVASTTPITGSTYFYYFSSWTNGDGLSGASGTYTTPSSAITVTVNYTYSGTTFAVNGLGSDVPSSGGGKTDVISNMSGHGASNVGYIVGHAITASASGQLLSIGINYLTGAGNGRVAIFSTYSGGKFSGLLTQSGSVALSNGWNDVSVSSVPIVSGVTYYIAWQVDSNSADVYIVNLGGNEYYQTFTYGVFTDPTGTLSTGTYVANMEINYVIGVGTLTAYTSYGGPIQQIYAISKFTTSSPYTVSSINLYQGSVSGTHHVHFGLYVDSSGPSSLVSGSDTGSLAVVASAGWQTYVYSTSFYLATGTYWFAFLMDSTTANFDGYTASGTYYYGTQTYGNLPSAFPASTSGTATISIYFTSAVILTINSTAYGLPKTFAWSLSSTHSVVATTPIAGSTYIYDFSSWTNGDGLSGASGTYTTPSGVVTVTVNYVARPIITFSYYGLGSDVSGSQTVLTIDSTGYVKSTFSFSINTWASGTTHTIAATTPITGSTYTYVWSSWTNGDGLSTASGTYTTPSSSITVVVNYLVAVSITFSGNGLGSDISGSTNVLVLDSVNITMSQLPYTVSWAVTSTHTVQALTPVTGSSATYPFQNWVNGNSGGMDNALASSQNYVVPNATEVVTANYQFGSTITIRYSGLGSDVSSGTSTIIVDGTSKALSTFPLTYGWTPNSTHYLTAFTPITGSSFVYLWNQWTCSPSGAQCNGLTNTSNPSGYFVTPTGSGSYTIIVNYSLDPLITFRTSGLNGHIQGWMLILTVDGAPYNYGSFDATGAIYFNWTASSTHTIVANTNFADAYGATWVFQSWANGDGLSGVSGTYTTPGSSSAVGVYFGYGVGYTWCESFTGGGTDVSGSQVVLTIDSTPYTFTQLTPCITFAQPQWPVSSTHVIGATTPINGSTYVYNWGSWTNGNGLSGASGIYIAPTGGATITVNYVATVTFNIIWTASGLGSDVTGGTVVLTIDGTPYTKSQLPYTFTTWSVGSNHTVNAAPSIAGSTYTYNFVSWTNGDGLGNYSSGTYTTPSAATTVVVGYSTAVLGGIRIVQSGLPWPATGPYSNSDLNGTIEIAVVDGVHYTLAQATTSSGVVQIGAPFVWIIGSPHSITIDTPIQGSVNRYCFTDWTGSTPNSDGLVLASGTYTVPNISAGEVLLVANFSVCSLIQVNFQETGLSLFGPSITQGNQPFQPWSWGGVLEASKIVATSSGNIIYLSVYATATDNVSNYIMGLYSDSAGYPGTLVAITLPFHVVAGWNKEILSTNIAVSPGDVYWIVGNTASLSSGTPTLWENFNTGDNAQITTGVTSPIWLAAPFTIGSTGHTITSVNLKLFRIGNPGTCTVGIRATINGLPTGPDLLTTGTYDCNTITTSPSGAWYQIPLPGTAIFPTGTYAIVLRTLGISQGNQVFWRSQYLPNPTQSFISSTDGGTTWVIQPNNGLMFEVWGSTSIGTAPQNLESSISSGTYIDKTWTYNGSLPATYPSGGSSPAVGTALIAYGLGDIGFNTTVLTIDGVAYKFIDLSTDTFGAGPKTFNWAANSSHTVVAADPITGTLNTYHFSSWTNGAGLVTASGTVVTPSITPWAITVNYVTTGVTFSTSGLGSDVAGSQVVLQIDALPVTKSQLPAQYQWGVNSPHAVVAVSPIVGSTYTYYFSSWANGDGLGITNNSGTYTTPSGPQAVTANYVTSQPIAISFTQNGLGSDVVSTTQSPQYIYDIDGVLYRIEDLPAKPSGWTAGSTHQVAVLPIVVVNGNPEYQWQNWTNGDGLSTYSGTYTVPSTASSVTANYATLNSFFNFTAIYYGLQVIPGGSATDSLAITNVRGNPQVTLSCVTPLPTGVSCSFSPSSGTATFQSALTISTTGSTPLGSWGIQVKAVGSAVTKQFPIILFVQTVIVHPPAYVTNTVTQTPIITVSTTATSTKTIFPGVTGGTQFDFLSAFLLLIVPFVCFTAIGYEAVDGKTSEGPILGAAIGAGIGILINSYLGYLPSWVILIVVICLAAAIGLGLARGR